MGLFRAWCPSTAKYGLMRSGPNWKPTESILMKQYGGLDVSLEQTAVCIVDEHGKALWRGKCASTPEAIASVVKARAPHVERIGLESGPLSTWHWHELKKRGLPVICLDARHAKAALSLQVNKTDPR